MDRDFRNLSLRERFTWKWPWIAAVAAGGLFTVIYGIVRLTDTSPHGDAVGRTCLWIGIPELLIAAALALLALNPEKRTSEH